MTRQFLFEETAQARPVDPASNPATPGEAIQSPQQDAPRDALAGVLPDWDLLPATPFIRRVK